MTLVVITGIFGTVGLSAWAHILNRRKELESTAARWEEVYALAESVHFLRDKSESLESENKDLRKQLGMSPMRRPAFQAESRRGVELDALAVFRDWFEEATARAKRKAKENHA